jgi:hypothetical protein
MAVGDQSGDDVLSGETAATGEKYVHASTS